jgi:carbon monoxide dehydrogenase subunit G
MKLEHEFRVPVPITQAWDVLLDVERIAPCMPGATVESFDGETVHGRVKVKVGPIQVTYGGTAKFVEKDDAAHRVTLDAHGKEARGSGTAAATIVAVLLDEGGSTLVNVTTDLAITGKPAQFGRGVMVEVGNKLIGRFADCLAEEIGIGSSGAADAPAAVEPASNGDPAAASGASGGDVAEPSGSAAGDEVSAAPDEVPVAADEVADGGGVGPAGVPAEVSAAAAGPTRVSSASSGSAQPRPLASPTASRASHRPAENEPIDLLDVGGTAILKRVAPLAVGLVVLLVLWRLVRRR